MANQYDMTCDQGAIFRKSMRWLTSSRTVIDLSGWTAKMQIKETLIGSSVIELSTANGKIAIDGTNGRISLALTETDTTGLTPGSYIYDLKLTGPDGPIRLLEGSFTVTPEVTA